MTNTAATKFYIIETSYFGPNPNQNLDFDRLEICTEPGYTNSSNEMRTEGWLGQTNDVSKYARGVFDTFEDAYDEVQVIWPENREEDVDELDYAFDESTVAVFRQGKYALIEFDGNTDDWVTIDSTDEEIKTAAEQLEEYANMEGESYVEGIDGLIAVLAEHRTDMREDVRAGLPEGYEIVEIVNPYLRTESLALVKAEPWIDQNGHLRWANKVARDTNSHGEVRKFADQDSGDGSVTFPTVIDHTDSWEEIADTAETLTTSVIHDLAEEIMNDTRGTLFSVMGALSNGNYSRIDIYNRDDVDSEDMYRLDERVVSFVPKTRTLWVTTLIPFTMESVDYHFESATLDEATAAAIDAHFAAEEDDDE